MVPKFHIEERSDTQWEIRLGNEPVGFCAAPENWDSATGHWKYRGQGRGGYAGNVGKVIEQLINAINTVRQQGGKVTMHKGAF